MGIIAAVLLVQCAWDSGPSPCSSFLPVFVHPISKCHAKVIIWAASVWSIKTGVMLEGPFTGPTQCTNECEVLSGLLCVTDTAKTAKCKLLWVVWAWDLNCKGQKSTSRNQHFSGWQGLQKAFSTMAISKPVQLWGQAKAFKALPWKIEIPQKYVQMYVQKISKVPSPFGQPAPMLDCPHDGKGSFPPEEISYCPCVCWLSFSETQVLFLALKRVLALKLDRIHPVRISLEVEFGKSPVSIL